MKLLLACALVVLLVGPAAAGVRVQVGPPQYGGDYRGPHCDERCRCERHGGWWHHGLCVRRHYDRHDGDRDY